MNSRWPRHWGDRIQYCTVVCPNTSHHNTIYFYGEVLGRYYCKKLYQLSQPERQSLWEAPLAIFFLPNCKHLSVSVYPFQAFCFGNHVVQYCTVLRRAIPAIQYAIHPSLKCVPIWGWRSHRLSGFWWPRVFYSLLYILFFWSAMLVVQYTVHKLSMQSRDSIISHHTSRLAKMKTENSAVALGEKCVYILVLFGWDAAQVTNLARIWASPMEPILEAGYVSARAYHKAHVVSPRWK